MRTINHAPQSSANLTQDWQNPSLPCSSATGIAAMQMTTDSFIYNPCDEEEDDMALACCHGSSTGDLFLLARFPDEDEVDITFRDDTIHVEDNITVTLTATQLLVEIDAHDAKPLGGDTRYEITHTTPANELAELDATLRIILNGVGTYVSQINCAVEGTVRKLRQM
jgi:hypothetical protein